VTLEAEPRCHPAGPDNRTLTLFGQNPALLRDCEA
jgi:hypothetical protein